jgi:hypothetical protein
MLGNVESGTLSSTAALSNVAPAGQTSAQQRAVNQLANQLGLRNVGSFNDLLNTWL